MRFFSCCCSSAISETSDDFDLIVESSLPPPRPVVLLDRYKTHQTINKKIYMPVYFYRRALDKHSHHFFQVDPLCRVVPLLKLGLSMVLELPCVNPSETVDELKARQIQCFIVGVEDITISRVTFVMVGAYQGRLQIFFLIALRTRIDPYSLPQLISWEDGYPKWVFMRYANYRARAQGLLPFVDSAQSAWPEFVAADLTRLQVMAELPRMDSEMLQMGSSWSTSSLVRKHLLCSIGNNNL